jgi:hypothetical protein
VHVYLREDVTPGVLKNLGVPFGVTRALSAGDGMLCRVEELPQRSAIGEWGRTALEAGVSAIPLIGGSLGVVLSKVMRQSYDKRLDTFLRQLADSIATLQEQSGGWPSFEELAESDVFVDAVTHAARASQATHQEEKLEALRNGVLHSLGPDAPTVDEQARFFRLVDQFSASHLRLLAMFNNPSAFGLPEEGLFMRGGVRDLIRQLPDFDQSPDGWLDLLARDLQDAGLTHFGPFGFENKYGETIGNTVSPLGRQFLAFIQAGD